MPDAVIGDRYRLVERLATGGMGTVWKAWDERLQRTVALKQLNVQPGLTSEDKDVAVERAMREARLTARLHHPNAVQVFDVIDDDGQPCLVMQYVPSLSLQDIVRDRGPRSPVEVARIGTQVAAALAAAHRVGIVHRDVKPGNVLIAEDGTAKITDFGISHAMDDVLLTSTGMVTGTPAYLAPEVARGEQSTFASDVFSLGSTLFMAVEGMPPFGNDQNPMAVLHRVASGNSLPSTRSGPLAPILREMMAADATARPDMVAVANALAGLPDIRAAAEERTRIIANRTPPPVEPTRAMPVAHPQPQRQPPPVLPPARPPAGRDTPPPPPPKNRRSSAWIPFAAAGLVVALGIVFAVLLLSDNGGDQNNAAGPTVGRTKAPTTRSTRPAPTSHASTPAQSTSSSASQPKPKPKPTPKTTPKTTPNTHPAGSTRATQLVQAIDDYYALMPGDTDAGWNRLTPRYQASTTGGRQNYQAFWGGIDQVDVSDASGSPPSTVVCTLTYHFKNGRVTTDRTQFGLVRQDGVLKIDTSEVINSQSQ